MKMAASTIRGDTYLSRKKFYKRWKQPIMHNIWNVITASFSIHWLIWKTQNHAREFGGASSLLLLLLKDAYIKLVINTEGKENWYYLSKKSYYLRSLFFQLTELEISFMLLLLYFDLNPLKSTVN